MTLELDGYRYTEAEIRHRIYGEQAYGEETNRWMLNDELIGAAGQYLFNGSQRGSRRGFIPPLMLTAMLDMGMNGVPRPPRPSTVWGIFRKHSTCAGVIHVPPLHWVFIVIRVKERRLGVKIYDSLGVSNETPWLRSRVNFFFARYFSDHRHYRERTYNYLPAPLQYTPFDCGVISLCLLERFFAAEKFSFSGTEGQLTNIAWARARLGRMLLRRSSIVIEEEPHEQQQQLAAENNNNKPPRKTDYASICQLVEAVCISQDDIFREATLYGFSRMDSDEDLLGALAQSRSWLVTVITRDTTANLGTNVTFHATRPCNILAICADPSGYYYLAFEYNATLGRLYSPIFTTVKWANNAVTKLNEDQLLYASFPREQVFSVWLYPHH